MEVVCSSERTVIVPSTGVAHIKPEFVLSDHERTLVLDCVSENDKEKVLETKDEPVQENSEPTAEPSNKKQRLSKHEKKKLRGQNKARPAPFKNERESSLCPVLVDIAENEVLPTCPNERCPFLHKVSEYLALKPADIGTTCYLYSVRGRCPRGVSCRFASQHTTAEGRNIVDKDLWEKFKQLPPSTINLLSKDLQAKLRKRTYDFIKTERVISKLDAEKKNSANKAGGEVVANNIADSIETILIEEKHIDGSKAGQASGAITDEDVITTREKEQKGLDWRDKLYLSPLTTVGNLPFRRVCKGLGADITCGEMAMATSLLQGMQQEWALVKRHESEKLFGVQLCGNNPYVMTRCAQLLDEQINVDFIDVNLGCPIELVYQQGAGSGLLRKERVLQSVISAMSRVVSLPLTVKTRTGIYMDKKIAHLLAPKFGQWGASLITVHGRSREQRYTRTADWEYIEECARQAGSTPVFGNGDILSFEDYEKARSDCASIAGVMIGRGALIKPWIFTEIKERKHWDISSSERLGILKSYANYGLEHWGSDTKGVENTRRFLLEWLSFLHRYIPVGLLEHPPQRINERPPFYRGRDELETLMASPNCGDWLKISEMLLGPVPENFHFLPKHKASSWK